ncbi:lysozyme, partial [Salmonella enterica]|nr:lysozyme [Salmonella enterica]
FRYSQGREMKGVVNRRTSEMTVFFDGVYIII